MLNIKSIKWSAISELGEISKTNLKHIDFHTFNFHTFSESNVFLSSQFPIYLNALKIKDSKWSAISEIRRKISNKLKTCEEMFNCDTYQIDSK